jgi:hypothetical protein
MLRYLAIMWAGLTVVALILVRRKTKEDKVGSFDSEEASKNKIQSDTTARLIDSNENFDNEEMRKNCPSVRTALRSGVYWYLFTMLICSSCMNAF